MGQKLISMGLPCCLKNLGFTLFSSVVQLCLTLCHPWTAAHQAPLSITNSQSLLKLMSIESVMPSNHLILCQPLLGGSEKSGKLEVGGASRHSTGFGALEEGLISS